MKDRTCDLCESRNYLAFPKFISDPEQVVICRVCGLIYTNPGWEEAELQEIYKTVFKDDPGAQTNRRRENYEEYRTELFEKAEGFMTISVIPALLKFIEPRGKKWLDVRFRAGALPVKLAEMGAEVCGIDIFVDNVEWLQTKLREIKIHRRDCHHLLNIDDGDFDAISMLTTHVPAHVPAPSAMFADAFAMLKKGGLLFVDEKDVTRISPKTLTFPFQYPYGMAHYFHLTLPTTRALIEKTGFEILHADYTERFSAQQHFLIVARKPTENFVKPPTATDFENAEPLKTYAFLMRKYVQLRWQQKQRNLFKKMTKSLSFNSNF